jgi:hypothetical protein
MFTHLLRPLVPFCLLAAFHAPAAVHYVNVGSTNPVPPFSSWATAANAIQDAIDASPSGDQVLVTNGVYQTGGHKSLSGDITNRVNIPNAVTVQSVNGPTVTIIQGYQPVGASNASNAVRCAALGPNALLAGFTLTGGQAGTGNFINGGGVIGIFGAPPGVVSNCVLTANIASPNGTGGGAYNATLVNCLLTSNRASLAGAAYNSTLINCTITGNSASNAVGGTYVGTLNNCIIYFNTAPSTSPANFSGGTLNNCCTFPLPGSGTGNITNSPGFVNPAAGNFRLQIGSPCVNTGYNAYASTGPDLDGNPRIFGGTVDMGAYESQFSGTIHYVSLTSTNPIPPFADWSTAATNIQDAIGAAQPGEYVVAADGNYNVGGTVLVYGQETNRVAVTNPITVLGLSGPQGATISGGTQTRCAYVGSNAVLSGFTLTGGQTGGGGSITNVLYGGGAWCEASAVVSNCVFIRNTASYGDGGGDYGGTVVNSVLSSNSASYGGGAAFASLINCTLVTNSAIANLGGGVYQSQVSNCLVISNWAYTGGGAASLSTLCNSMLTSNVSSLGAGGADKSTSYNCFFAGNHGGAGGGAQDSTNFNCTFSGNSSSYGGGTYSSTNYECLLSGNTASLDGGGAYGGDIYNCIVAGNTATNNGGLGGGVYLANAVNCTIISNMASSSGGGITGGNVYNSIIYYNSAPAGSNWSGNDPEYCCTVPPGTGSTANTFCFTNPPVFVNLAAGDFHQQTNSPTINGGNNVYLNRYATYFPALLTTDFDGNPRIVGGTVDIGAYEYQGSNLGLPISIPWLMKYNLPTDGSANYLDSDGDGQNNWQEWVAGTDPTNPSSVLKMLPPSPGGGNFVVTWKSVLYINYYVQRASDLSAQPAFQTIATNIPGQTGTTSYTDTNAPASGPYYCFGGSCSTMSPLSLTMNR